MSRFLAVAAAGAVAAQALAGAAHAQSEDRYGPVPSGAITAARTTTAVALLSWPGKAAAPSPPADAAQANPAPDVVQVATAAPRDLPTSLYAPPPSEAPPVKLRGVILADPAPSPAFAPPEATAPAPTPLPSPVASAPPPPTPAAPPAPAPMAAATPAPAQVADASGHSATPPRYYSVAREYGVQPDPDPLPAQFFASAPGSDMAAPPPPLDPRPVPGTQAATSPANSASNRARQSALQTADAGADGPTGGAGN